MKKGRMTREEREAFEALEKLREDENFMKTGVISGKTKEELEAEREIMLKEIDKEMRLKKVITTVVLAVIFVLVLVVIFKISYNRYLRPVKRSDKINTKSIHYTNDIYTADGYFYQKFLNPDERKEYLRWIDSIKNMNKVHVVNYENFKSKSIAEIEKSFLLMYQIIQVEHPELFYFESFIFERETSLDEGIIKVRNIYQPTTKFVVDLKMKRLERKIDDVVREMNATSDLAKIKEVYEYFAKKTLDLEHLEGNNITSAFLSDKTSCKSIALGSQVLFQRLGIKSQVAHGTLYDADRSFNVIKLDDGYYFFDPCVAIEVRMGDTEADHQSGMLLFNTYDYDTGFYDIREEDLGEKYKYKMLG